MTSVICASCMARVGFASGRESFTSTMTVDRGGRWFEIDGVRVDISRRRVLRRIVIALVRRREASPGEEIETNELLAAGWPGERVMPDAAGRRVRTAIWELRRMGLGRSLTTKGFGYAIEPSTSIVWSDAPLLAGDAVR